MQFLTHLIGDGLAKLWHLLDPLTEDVSPLQPTEIFNDRVIHTVAENQHPFIGAVFLEGGLHGFHWERGNHTVRNTPETRSSREKKWLLLFYFEFQS